MPVTEFQPVLDPNAMMGACAGAIVGVSAVVMEVQARVDRSRCVGAIGLEHVSSRLLPSGAGIP